MMRSVERWVTRGLKAVSIGMFALLVIVVSWQVFTRQVLGDSASWTEEMARYTFIVLIFLTASLVFLERGHIAVEVFVRRLPDAGQRVVALGIEAIVLFFAGWVLIWGGFLITANSWNQQMSALPASVGQVYLVMPVAGVLISYACVLHIVALLRGGKIWLISADDEVEA